MQFATSALALVAAASSVSAATLTFWNLDDVSRTIHCTPSAPHPKVDSVDVSNAKNTTIEFPDNWIGNCAAVPAGAPAGESMLAEVAFGVYNGLTFYDVSAIVNPKDHTNVKQMWPVDSTGPVTGCETYPCDTAYWHPDDVQTKSTLSKDLMVSLGHGSTGIKFAV